MQDETLKLKVTICTRTHSITFV